MIALNTSILNREFMIEAEDEMLNLGQQCAVQCKKNLIIYLQGDLGAGKTTFARGFLRGLGYHGLVKSPTYTLVETYEFSEKQLYHFDCYRVRSPEELEYIGIRDYANGTAICLIEWPELASEWLPEPDLNCYIECVSLNKRCVRFYAMNLQAKALLEALV